MPTPNPTTGKHEFAAFLSSGASTRRLRSNVETFGSIPNPSYISRYFDQLDLSKYDKLKPLLAAFPRALHNKTYLTHWSNALLSFAVETLFDEQGEIRPDVYSPLNQQNVLGRIRDAWNPETNAPYSSDHIKVQLLQAFIAGITYPHLQGIAEKEIQQGKFTLEQFLGMMDIIGLKQRTISVIDAAFIESLKKPAAFFYAFDDLVLATGQTEFQPLKDTGESLIAEFNKVDMTHTEPSFVDELARSARITAQAIRHPTVDKATEISARAERVGQYSRGKVIGGILLCVAGAILVISSIVLLLGTFGFATPFALPGFLTGHIAIGTGLGTAGLGAMGLGVLLFSRTNNVVRKTEKIQMDALGRLSVSGR